MKKSYLFACAMPWLVLVGGFLIEPSYRPMNVSIGMAGMLWLIVSPIYIALVGMLAFREGQYSKIPLIEAAGSAASGALKQEKPL